MKYVRPEMEVIEFEIELVRTTVVEASQPISDSTDPGTTTPWVPRIY